MLVPTDESKGSLKKYGELWKKIRDITRSITNNSHNYDDRHMEIKFNSDYDLPLKKALELYELTIVCFSWRQQYYPEVFLEECLL